ncbi:MULTISPECIES: efflux transporter outer membrane subunit [Butyricimonas]|uniref:efflux transporter outer membrane subunit n=1 Tax=Butyricimonas TaxID=574697 RepID=UPI001D087BCA|nr:MULTISPECIES: TolC family protein [Butyricimonas]MCB6970965.1 TolC family protein [Butyricimonas synergistica]MCG4517679.1 TolC family protein [Butyricimonas sp. DFI.6.44]
MKRVTIYALSLGALLSSCNIYKQYNRPEVDVQGLYRDPVSVTDTLTTDTTNMGNLPWEEVFTDPQLQQLIRLGLEQNSDLQTAVLKVKEAEAGLMSSRLAYLPSLGLSPQGTVSSFDKMKASQTYTLPVVSSWEIDLFGRLLNAKRGAKVMLLQSEAYKQAVQTQVISAIANAYYTLLMLDKQLAITEETALLWQKSVETMKAMKEAGMVNEAAIAQSEANSYMIAASIPDLKQSIRETENSLSLLLKQAPQRIERGKLEDQNLPTLLNAGVPVQLLSNRPDVKAAEMALASTFYNTNQARASFYPQLTINGTLGWTNNSGMGIVNPGKMIATAVGSLAQPIFNKGALTARLRIAKAQQEEAMISFEQSLLNAGSEVSNALTQYQTAQDKIIQREKQIFSLEKSVDYTQELLTLGTSTYLEVLTAQQSLLSAQLSGISDEFQRMQAVVNLYHALGGGRTE